MTIVSKLYDFEKEAKEFTKKRYELRARKDNLIREILKLYDQDTFEDFILYQFSKNNFSIGNYSRDEIRNIIIEKHYPDFDLSGDDMCFAYDYKLDHIVSAYFPISDLLRVKEILKENLSTAEIDDKISRIETRIKCAETRREQIDKRIERDKEELKYVKTWKNYVDNRTENKTT